jgi:hypothetical protein
MERNINMRLNEYVNKDFTEFKMVMENSMDLPDANKILQQSWIKFRETLINEDQKTVTSIINKNFSTDFKNIYFLKDSKSKQYTINQKLLACCDEINEAIINSQYYSEEYNMKINMVRGLLWITKGM